MPAEEAQRIQVEETVTQLTVQPVDVDLTDTPSCGIEVCMPPGTWYCGNPAVARISSTCPCRGTVYEFVCQPCLDLLHAGKYRCGTCKSAATVSWRMA
jgi:hypothetical protein